MIRALRLSLLLLAACVPEHGQNGPTLATPASGEGPCFEVTLMDGLADGAEVELLFACFNAHGAFDPLASSVAVLATHPQVDALLGAIEGPGALPEVEEALDAATGLLSAPEDPLGHALDAFVELYEGHALVAFSELTRLGAQALVDCEDGPNPSACSLPRLGLRLLESDLAPRLERLQRALAEEAPDDDALRASLERNARFMERASTADGGDNVVVAAGRALLRPYDRGASSLARLQPYLAALLETDRDADGVPDAIETLAPYVAETWASGGFERLPDALLRVNTRDVSGNEVGFEGNSMLNQLLVNAEALSTDADPTLLFQPMQIGSATLTPYQAGLNFVDEFYGMLNDGRSSRDDVRRAMVSEVASIVDDICVAVGRSDPFCRQVGFIEDALVAILNTGLPVDTLPLTYGLLQAVDPDDLAWRATGRHLDELEPEDFEAVAAWADSLTRDLEPLSQISLEEQLMVASLEQLPTFFDMERGALTQTGADAMALLAVLVQPWSGDGGPEVVPLLVVEPVGYALLSDEAFGRELDWVMGQLAPRLLDEASALHIDRLLASRDALEAHLPESELDPLATARDTLANEALWTATLRLGADPEVAALMLPQEGEGGPWMLYDLIQRGVLDRMIEFVSGALDALLAEDDASED